MNVCVACSHWQYWRNAALYSVHQTKIASFHNTLRQCTRIHPTPHHTHMHTYRDTRRHASAKSASWETGLALWHARNWPLLSAELLTTSQQRVWLESGHTCSLLISKEGRVRGWWVHCYSWSVSRFSIPGVQPKTPRLQATAPSWSPP